MDIESDIESDMDMDMEADRDATTSVTSSSALSLFSFRRNVFSFLAWPFWTNFLLLLLCCGSEAWFSCDRFRLTAAFSPANGLTAEQKAPSCNNRAAMAVLIGTEVLMMKMIIDIMIKIGMWRWWPRRRRSRVNEGLGRIALFFPVKLLLVLLIGWWW